MPWADEAEQQLSRLDPSGCELSPDFRFCGQGLPEDRGRNPLRYVGSLRWQDKQAAPVSVPLYKQYHVQMKLSNSFEGQPLLAASYLLMFKFSEEQHCKRHPAGTP